MRKVVMGLIWLITMVGLLLLGKYQGWNYVVTIFVGVIITCVEYEIES